MMPAEYYPMFLFFALAAVVCTSMTMLATFLGPYRPTAIKVAPFECGNPGEATGRKRFGVKFYVVGLLFILFDIEIVFIYPWAVQFKRLGWVGFSAMLAFLVVLGLGLVYIWRKGALQWED